MSKLNYAINNKEVLEMGTPIKILMVVDGQINFTNNINDIESGAPPFGLGYIIGILKDSINSPEHVNLEIGLATREESIESDYSQPYTTFKFDQQEAGNYLINQYDEIWLFGFNGESDNFEKLSEVELQVLHNWMDNGGGILAMGDHADLGAAMCKDIKRVCYMRRWTTKQGVPLANGPDRHDTNRPANSDQKKGDEHMPFKNQSDAVLQPLYSNSSHPILDIPNQSRLDLFPDHPHEGWVYEDGEGIEDHSDDFPDSSLPETIAWVSTFIQTMQTSRDKDELNQKRFGALGVYDGHQADVGRIVVDSTWHHWFNINLVGMRDDTKSNNYERYKTFVRNVATWLAPKNLQKQIFCRAIWLTLFTSEVIEDHYIKDFSWTYKKVQPVLKTFISESLRKEWLSFWYPMELLCPVSDSSNGLLYAWSSYTCPHWKLLEAEILQGVIEAWRPLILEIITNKRTHVEEQNLISLFEKGASKGAMSAMSNWHQVIVKQQTMQGKCAATI